MKALTKRLFSLAAGAVLVIPAVSAQGYAERAASLAALDRALDRSTEYIAARQQTIDSAVAALPHSQVPADELLKIADAYTSFNTDSAVAYLNRGLATTSGTAQLPFRWRRASLLPLTGFFERAVAEYNAIDPDSVPAGLLPSYLDAGRQMHSYIAAFAHGYPEIRRQHNDSALALQRRLLEALPRQSIQYKYNQAEYYFMLGRTEMAKVLLEEIFANLPATSNLRARTAHHLAAIAKEEGMHDAYIYYLAESARADVEAATREMVSLQELGTNLDAEDVDRAYRYLSVALENAVTCGAALRTLDTTRTLPLIERAHSANLAAKRHTIYVIMGLMGLLLLVLVALILLLRYEMARMKVLQQNLRHANREKEVYISQFLQLCSIYMDKLNQFCKIATRKLAAGQSDELYRMTKSGKFVEEQSREFYEVFDNAFLHIYPDFVREVNRLLRPDAQIELKEGERMNTDLRILAFMRLGIEESARIAQVLNYSLNTIYSYRNRLKARAIDKETFESDISRIDSVE